MFNVISHQGNANQSHNETTSHPLGMVGIKKRDNN